MKGHIILEKTNLKQGSTQVLMTCEAQEPQRTFSPLRDETLYVYVMNAREILYCQRHSESASVFALRRLIKLHFNHNPYTNEIIMFPLEQTVI